MRSIEQIQDTPLAQRTQSLPQWTRQDDRSNAVARESVARNPHARMRHSLYSVVNLLGLWPLQSQENRFWSDELRGFFKSTSNHRAAATDFAHLPAAVVEDVFARTQSDIGPWARSDQARVYDTLWRAAETLRPLWAALMLVGLIGALGRRQWPLFIVGTMVIAHAGYLGFVLLTGIDRYQVPLYPVMTVLAVYGLACFAGVAPMSALAAPDNKPNSDPSSRTTRFR
jgi:hypothetical protein